MPDERPKDLPLCPMGIDPLSAIGVLVQKVDANTELTQCVSRKMDVHAESHKRIDEHIVEVKRVLFDPNGIVAQARDCQNFRTEAAKRGPEWAGWLAAGGGILAALAVVAQVLVMIWKK